MQRSKKIMGSVGSQDFSSVAHIWSVHVFLIPYIVLYCTCVLFNFQFIRIFFIMYTKQTVLPKAFRLVLCVCVCVVLSVCVHVYL